MTKTKKIIISVVSAIEGIVLILYLSVGLFFGKPGINGFAVMHGVTRLILSGKDYVKVGEDRYLFRQSSLKELIEKEYDSSLGFINIPGSIYGGPERFAATDFMSFDEFWEEYPSDIGNSVFCKSCYIEKNGIKLHSWLPTVYSPVIEKVLGGETVYSAYFAPLDEE